tara:strand:- start:17846 stop:18211 length:366 start_codon:yes stop_codon:yes gene_type:complete
MTLLLYQSVHCSFFDIPNSMPVSFSTGSRLGNQTRKTIHSFREGRIIDGIPDFHQPQFKREFQNLVSAWKLDSIPLASPIILYPYQASGKLLPRVSSSNNHPVRIETRFFFEKTNANPKKD